MKRLLMGSKMITVIILGLMAGPVISADGTEQTGTIFKDCAACPEMVVIPPGTFIMGSPETEKYREDDEAQHKVTIAYSFAVSKAPITWDQWEACARDAMCDGQAVEKALRESNQGKPETEKYTDYGRGNRPVIGVSWWDAQAFVGWLNKKTGKDKYRLLSESEYEYTARAGTVTAYWWGEDPSHEYANYGREADQELGGAVEGRDLWGDETSPVCSFTVNGFGLCDMAGNVYQWIEDCYEADGAKLPTDGSAVKNGNCTVRGFRGNSFMSDPKSLRSANRAFVYSPDSRGRSYLGIRVAKTLGRPFEENKMVSLTPPANVTRIKLYEKTPDVITFTENELNPMEPTLDLYIPDADRATGAGVLLCPGGGYEMLTVPGEGGTIAEFFKAHNIAAFVVRYRHGPQYHYPTTLLDGQRALRHIKANAKEYNVDPEMVGVFGGSAGGHLAAMLATLYNNRLLPEAPYAPDGIDSLSARPAFALLLYPVIDLTDDSVTHKGSRKNLTQENPDLYEALSPWKHVTKDIPPAFIVHGTYDFLVPVKNSILFYEACIKEKVPTEMHLLDIPMHGFGIGANLDDKTVKEWPEQAIRFIERHTGSKQ